MVLSFESQADAKANTERIFPWRQLYLPLEGIDPPTERKLVCIGGDKSWAIRRGDRVEFQSIFQQRFERILDAAGPFRDEIEINGYGYAEPGYDEPECGLICLANWNNKDKFDPSTKKRVVTDNRPERVSKLLEKLGVEIEWSDQWITCEDCYKLARTDADCMSWSPSYAFIGDCTVLCKSCIEEDPSDYIEQIQGTDDPNGFSIDFSEHGLIQVPDVEYDSNTDRRRIKAVLDEAGIDDYLFDNNDTTVWVPAEEYRGRVRELQALLENRDQDINDYLGDLTDSLDILELAEV